MSHSRQGDRTDVEPQRAKSSESDIVPLATPPAHLVEQTKNRHRADLDKHAWEAPRAERVQDAWEVAYVWAFILRFDLLKEIKGLETVDDLENGLCSWIPDEVLQNVLIVFLGNLKPSLAGKLDSESLQPLLSKYIHEQLTTTHEFTVWDRPWAPNEDGRASCCRTDLDDEERMDLGRLRYRGEPMSERGKQNPIQGFENGSGGLWTLPWEDRAKLLRQMVDWQLTNCNAVREKIKDHYRIKTSTTSMNFDPASNPLMIVPIGQDRNRNRIWSFDDSPRLYSSGNPFKRPCPLVTYTQTKAEFLSKLEQLDAVREAATPPSVTAALHGKRAKQNREEYLKAKKLVAAKQTESKLADAMQNLLPEIEKHEQKVIRAQKRILAAATLAALTETKTTRTRRQTHKPDYVYDGIGDEDSRRGSKRRYDGDYQSDGSDEPSTSTSTRPVIPGERRSTRVAANGVSSNLPTSRRQSREPSDSDALVPPSAGTGSSTCSTTAKDGVKAPKVKGMKGYAWVEDEATGPTELLAGSEPEMKHQEQSGSIEDDLPSALQPAETESLVKDGTPIKDEIPEKEEARNEMMEVDP